MRFRGDTHQVGYTVGAAMLPSGPRQVLSNLVNKSRMGITGDKSHPGESSGASVDQTPCQQSTCSNQQPFQMFPPEHLSLHRV
jgi:hypothetical protein